MDQTSLQRLAEIGAAQRLAEIDQERAALLRSFPALRGGTATASRRSTRVRRVKPTARRRRRSTMSAEARKAVSLRMKKYWAARRKSATKATKRAKA